MPDCPPFGHCRDRPRIAGFFRPFSKDGFLAASSIIASFEQNPLQEQLMNVKKFTAPTSREALRKVREALGPDAVILSNRQSDGMVEILALANDDAASLASPADYSPMTHPEPQLELPSQPVRRVVASHSSYATATAAAATPSSAPVAAPANPLD